MSRIYDSSSSGWNDANISWGRRADYHWYRDYDYQKIQGAGSLQGLSQTITHPPAPKCPQGHIWNTPHFETKVGDGDFMATECTVCGEKAFLPMMDFPPVKNLYEIIDKIESGADWTDVVTMYDLIMRRMEKARAVQQEAETVLKIIEKAISKHVVDLGSHEVVVTVDPVGVVVDVNPVVVESVDESGDNET